MPRPDERSIHPGAALDNSSLLHEGDVEVGEVGGGARGCWRGGLERDEFLHSDRTQQGD